MRGESKRPGCSPDMSRSGASRAAPRRWSAPPRLDQRSCSKGRLSDWRPPKHLRILQATSTAMSVFCKPLQYNKRGFDDSSSPSAKIAYAESLSVCLIGPERPRNSAVFRGRLCTLD
jgi:hypothetical protein